MASKRNQMKSTELRIRVTPHYKNKLNAYALQQETTASMVIREYIRRLPDRTGEQPFDKLDKPRKKDRQSSPKLESGRGHGRPRKQVVFDMSPCYNCGYSQCRYDRECKMHFCLECYTEIEEENLILEAIEND
jgi:hypothetical protein